MNILRFIINLKIINLKKILLYLKNKILRILFICKIINEYR